MLILAAISIATLTGENGVLTKASKAEKDTDIAETKEQIKLELMGTYNEQKTNYTNSDVIDAVKEITGEEIEENTAIIHSKKGNNVDISDLWKVIKEIQFFLQGTPLTAYEGETWGEWRKRNKELIQNTNFGDDAWNCVIKGILLEDYVTYGYPGMSFDGGYSFYDISSVLHLTLANDETGEFVSDSGPIEAVGYSFHS